MERLLEHDPVSGMRTWFSSSDDDGGTWTLRYEQDTAPVIDACKAAQNEGWDRRSEMWHAGHIPNVVIMEWMHRYGVNIFDKNHAPAVRRLLDDPDYRYLRVRHFMMGKH